MSSTKVINTNHLFQENSISKSTSFLPPRTLSKLSATNLINKSAHSQYSEIAFIAPTVPDYLKLAPGVRPEVEAVILEDYRDAIAQITEILSQRHDISVIHLISHGTSGKIAFGDSELSSETINQYASQLQQWKAALSKDAALLIYGCEVAKGEQGLALIHILSELTGVTIRASATRTGNVAGGGDWHLEVSIAEYKEDSLAFGTEILASYQGVFAPTLVGEWDFLSYAFAVTVVGNYAYAVGDTLEIIDISNSSNPLFKGVYNTPQGTDVQVVGNYAYVADDDSGLKIIDISNPATPILKGNYNTTGTALEVEVVGNYAYVADGSLGLKIIDISNPTTPILKGNYNTTGSISDVQVVGNYAYVANDYAGLKIIDISNLTTPTLKGSYNTSGDAWGVQVVGNYAYVADGSLGLKIIDISNPTTPILKGNYNTDGYAYGVQVVGNYAYVADSSDGLKIINVSEFTANQPTIALSVSPASVLEDGTPNLLYTFTCTGSFTNPLTVNFGVSGTATLNTDYTQTGATTFNATTGTVTFAANSSTAIVTINPTTDITVEPNETVGITLASATGYSIGTTSAVTGTITNDDGTPLPSITLAVSPASVTEDGTGNLVYTFTRTGSLTNPLTVNYGITGTATNGTDYGTIGTSVAFLANSATATVTVNPTADTIVEPNETVALTLASNAAYTIGTTSAVTGTITNDDVVLPTVTLAVSPASVLEDGTPKLLYTFTRTGSLTNPLTVNFGVSGTATLNTDYIQTGATSFNATIGSITFAANSNKAIVTVDPTGDTTVEPNETLALTLTSNAAYTIGTTTAVTGTITNDDIVLPILSIDDITIIEGNSGKKNATFTVTRSGTATKPITVKYATANGIATVGSDYTSTTGSLTFATNEITKTINVPIIGDTTVEPNETFFLNLTNPTNATITDNQGLGTITNEYTPSNVTFSLDYSGISENSPTNFTYTFTRIGSLTNSLIVNFNVAGTATFGTDYAQTGATSFTSTTGKVTFAANSATAKLVINPTGDTIVESNETVALTLTSATDYVVGTATPITATMINDDGTRRQIATNRHLQKSVT